MTTEQLNALIQYVRAVAERQAVLVACGSDEGGYGKRERACEDELRRVFTPQNI